ncbi:50S ribosomal protein L9 [Candidatus Haliotispira prima]|uniref:Large ribosomal subunit protein bL9 n=1 Tax=Candidatus Haliotispira prima TaxID=3034016 RepID=A0ABY8MEY2_9SPIO|nr:50S ribosomal protein L9 [Candidatus Haliotispira prima]
MKIILNEDVKNLGEEGDICVVKDGYARNFLLPRNIAAPHNRMNINNLQAKEQAITARKEQKRKEALGLKDRLEKEASIEIVMPSADGGRLFGAVTNATIAEQLAHLGVNIERKRIEIPGRTIKMVGNYTVKIRLYDEQTANLKVLIRSLEEEKKEEEQAAAEAAAAEAAAETGEAAETAETEATTEETEESNGEGQQEHQD